MTVDGGTDRWMTWLKINNCEGHKNVAPDMITGDMDSVSEEVLLSFARRNKRLEIIKTENQNETDFTKALREVEAKNNTANLQVHNLFFSVLL